MLDQRIYTGSHTRVTRDVDQRILPNNIHLATRGDLRACLQLLVVSCQVDSYSEFTIRDYQDKLGKFVNYLASMGITSPGKVTPSHIRLFLLKKKEEGCNQTTISNNYRAVHRYFSWLVEEHVIKREANPMANIKPPRVPETIIVPFQAEHIKRLLLLCDDRKFLGARNRAIILVFVDTGLRLSEMASIQIADIDFDHETIKVMGKGAKERVVRIGKTAQKVVLRYLLMRSDNLPCLWVSEERRPLTHWGIEIVVQRLGKRAGLKNVRCSPHTFRHTFATDSLEYGAAEWEVQSLLGHSTLTMTRRYTKTLRSQKAAMGHRRFSPVDNMRL